MISHVFGLVIVETAGQKNEDAIKQRIIQKHSNAHCITSLIW